MRPGRDRGPARAAATCSGKATLVRPRAGSASSSSSSRQRRHRLAEPDQHRRVRPEGDHREVVPLAARRRARRPPPRRCAPARRASTRRRRRRSTTARRCAPAPGPRCPRPPAPAARPAPRACGRGRCRPSRRGTAGWRPRRGRAAAGSRAGPGHREPGRDLPGLRRTSASPTRRVGTRRPARRARRSPRAGRSRPGGIGPARSRVPRAPSPPPRRGRGRACGASVSCLGLRRSGRAARPAGPPGAAQRRVGRDLSSTGRRGGGPRMKWSSQIWRSTCSGVVSAASSRWIRPDSATTIASKTRAR